MGKRRRRNWKLPAKSRIVGQAILPAAGCSRIGCPTKLPELAQFRLIGIRPRAVAHRATGRAAVLVSIGIARVQLNGAVEIEDGLGILFEHITREAAAIVSNRELRIELNRLVE